MQLRAPLVATLTLIAGALSPAPALASAPSAVPTATTTQFPGEATALGCGDACTTVLNHTGALQEYTVPAGATRLLVELEGGQGGSFSGGPVGGKAGRTTAVVPVEAGDVLDVAVGGKGGTGGLLAFLGHAFGGGGQAGSFLSTPAGGGGGGSFLYDATGDLLLAAGGGGGATLGAAGGKGGAAEASATAGANGSLGTGGGKAATTLANGLGGAAGNLLLSVAGAAGTGSFPGSLPIGGTGGSALSSGGGGGGGFFAGGGGGSLASLTSVFAAGGGGGSGWADPVADLVEGVAGIGTGDGQVTITALGDLLEQVLTFGAPPASPLVGGTYVPSLLSSAGLPTSLAVDPSSAGVCSLSSGTVTFLGAGECILNGSALGTLLHLPGSVQQVIQVKATQVLSFLSSPPSGAVPGDSYDVLTAATSGLSATLSVAPESAGVCELTGNTLDFLSPGECVLEASQLGDLLWAVADTIQQVITVFPEPAATCDGSGADAGCTYHWVEQQGAETRACVVSGGCEYLDRYANASVADLARSYFHDAGPDETSMCVGGASARWGEYAAGDRTWASLASDPATAFGLDFASATACAAEVAALLSPTATLTTPADAASYTSGDEVTFAATLTSASPGAMTCSFTLGAVTVPGTVHPQTRVCTSTTPELLSVAHSSVAVTATDSSGQTASDSHTITVATDTDTTAVQTLAPATALAGSRVRVRGVLTRGSSAPVAGQLLRLVAGAPGKPLKPVGSAVTDASGIARLRITLARTAVLQWRYAGEATAERVLDPSRSVRTTVGATPKLTAKVGRTKTAVTVSARGLKVSLRVDGRKTGKAVIVPRSGKVRFTYPALKRGPHTVVVSTTATTRYAAARLTRTVRF